MLATYPEIRDRIYALARKHAFRVDWRETTRNSRLLLLYDSKQVVVARARVPLRHMDPDVLAELAYQLEDVFGEGWMKLKNDGRQLKVRVLKKDGYWVGMSDDLAGGSTGDTLPELFAEIEFFKHSCAGSLKDAQVFVEYVAGQPEIAPELNAIYAAYLALPAHLRPVAVPWDLGNDRPPPSTLARTPTQNNSVP